MIEFLLYSIIICFLFIFSGLGLSILFCPSKLQKYSLFFSPFIGLSYIIFLGWIFAHGDFGGTNNYSNFLMVPSFLFLILSIVIKRNELLQIFSSIKKENFFIIILCSILFLFISIPFFLKIDNLTTMSLQNNDIALYAAVGKYLMYSSLSDYNSIINPTIVFYASNINALFASTLALAFPGSIYHIEPYKISNIVLYLFFIFDLLISYIICKKIFNYDNAISCIICLFIGINFNLLFILYQDFFAQILGMGFFLCLIIVIYYPIIKDINKISDFLEYIPFAIILSFGLMTVYEPLIPLFIIPLILYFAITFAFFRNTHQLVTQGIYFLIIIVSIAIFYPASILDYFRKISVISGQVVGWNIPIFNHYLSPDRIFGLFISDRSIMDMSIIGFFLSLLILMISFYSIKSVWNDDKKLFLFSISNLTFVVCFYTYLITKEAFSSDWSGEGYKDF